MSNILLTNFCNLRCSYCFATHYTQADATEITLEAFDEILNFIASSSNPNEKIGLIGGEPTLHSRFGEILNILKNDERFSNICIFTNGVYVGKYLPYLRHPKFHVLVNFNSEEFMGADAYRSMCDNIDLLMKDVDVANRVTLGINISKADFLYQYIIDMLKKYNMHTVRVSVVCPNSSEKRAEDVFDFLDRIKPRLMQFFKELLENDIIPCYDCNKPPNCIWSRSQMEELSGLMEKSREKCDQLQLPLSVFERHDFAIHSKASKCYPVVDIFQDLTAIRCFGIGDISRVSIRDFSSLDDLRSYYISHFDEQAYSVCKKPQCESCALRREKHCMGGCIAYKVDYFE